MNHKLRFFIIFLSAIFSNLFSQEDSDSLFFSELEEKLLQKYKLCTGDSLPSRKALLKWKSDISLITESQEYPELVKMYATETGLNPIDVHPCQIINWSIQRLRDKEETAVLLEQSKERF